jgi:thiol-disulfide isomerase/thioredoxin
LARSLKNSNWVKTSVAAAGRVLAAAILLVVCVLPGTSAGPSAAPVSLTLNDLSGKSHSLKEYRGKVIVLNFWATWCFPCREEMPMLNKLAAEYAASEKVAFLAVSLDDAATRPKIPRFLEKKKITLPVFTGATSATLADFGLAGVVPGTVVLNPEGVAEFRIVGEASKKDIMSRVEWLLSDRSSKKPKELQKNL